MDKSVWKEAIREDADKEGMGPHDRCERRVHTKERKGIPIIERKERGGKRICERAVVKRVYLTVKVTTNGASILCGEERWEKTDGAGL